MRNAGEKIGKSIILLLLGIVIGTLLLLGAYCIPVNMQKAEESMQMMELEGEYPNASSLHNNAALNFGSYEPTVLDNATDIL